MPLCRAIAALIVLINALSATASAAEPAALSTLPGRSAPTLQAAVQAHALKVRTDLFAAAPDRLRLQLPAGEVWAYTRALELHADQRFSWHGSIDVDGQQPVVISVAGDSVAGFLSMDDGMWELVPAGPAGEAWLIKLDDQRLPGCAGPVAGDEGLDVRSADDAAPTAASAGTRGTDSGEQIDVLLFYTAAAQAAAGSENAIRAQAQAAVDSANTAFANSAMRMRFRAVGIELLEGWEETTDAASTELSRFRSNPTATARRNAVSADMVSLLVANLPGACGIGYVMRSIGPGFAGSAFQISDRDCAVGNLSWAHEHGHNLGFEHDPANGTSPETASRPWSFGHYVEGQGSQSYRTVMSYACPAGGCTRRAHFSNPQVLFNGFATGVLDERDNARTGDEVADTVANFRVAWGGFSDGFEPR